MDNKDNNNSVKKTVKNTNQNKKKPVPKKDNTPAVKKEEKDLSVIDLEKTDQNIDIEDIVPEKVKEEKLEETIDDIDIVFNPTREVKVEKEEIAIRQARKEIEKEMAKNKEQSAKKKKYKLNVKGIILIVLIILAVDAIFAGCIIFLSDSEGKEPKQEEKKEEKKENKDKKDKKKEETKTEPEKERDKYDLEKLKVLNDIDTKIDFFKYENIDRYIAYKESHSNISDEMVVVYVNIGLDKEFYSDTKESPFINTNKTIVNKFYAVSSNYEPAELEPINESYSSRYLKMTPDAAAAFNKMAEAAKAEGYTVRAVSTYRSYTYQSNLYNNYAATDGVALADTYSARPGHSEHHTGLAVDVDNANLSYTSFGNSKEFNWMKENAYKFGFILRYTKENEWITGYKDEPWHYRYVGEEIAKYIQENPMSFEEYFVRFLDK